MPISQIDAQNGGQTALIVIDMQKGITGLPVAHPVTAITAHVTALLAAFRAKTLPIVLVNVAGAAPGRNDQPKMDWTPPADWAELIPELDAQPSDHRVTKTTWGAFEHTDLHDYLKAQGVTQVVICGIATSIGVESTARVAYERGYNVVLIPDAMTDLDREMHDHAVAKIFPRIGEIGTTADVVERLA